MAEPYQVGVFVMERNLTGLITNPVVSASRPHRLLGIFGMIWLTFLLLVTFTQLKTFSVGSFVFSVGVITYPFTYIFSDIFTEVYGYRVSRKVVWTGFVCVLIASTVASLYTFVPSSSYFESNDAFNVIFRASPVIAVATILGFFGGELTNSYVLAKLKIYTGGSHGWFRMIGSTVAGQLVDNTTFFTLGFLAAGIYTGQEVLSLVLTSVIFCTAWETIALPYTYRVISLVKRAEGLDTYDVGTNFNPFNLNR